MENSFRSSLKRRWVISMLIAVATMTASLTAWSGERFLVKFKPGSSAAGAAKIFSETKAKTLDYIQELGIYVIEFKDLKHFDKAKGAILGAALYVERDAKVKALTTPNDPNFDAQDGLIRTDVKDAWNTTIGSKSVIVAVSDTGFSFNHSDLKNQVWTNPNEVAGNGVDDDQNGFIDDVHGWNFSDNNNDPDDKNMHGSHVSGIIGAEGNNGNGVAGMNWNVTIMPVQFLNKSGEGVLSEGIRTIVYAADNGARIVNCSWGAREEPNGLKDAIDYAYGKGTLVIAAAGNDKVDNEEVATFPASSKSQGIISVASSDANGKLSGFSNFGQTNVMLAAPGSNILSTIPGNGYRKASGTSMASPMVAGIGALMLSVKPELSALQLKNGLINAVVERSSYVGKLATAGDTSAKLAVSQLAGGFQVWPARITVPAESSFQFAAYDAQGAVSWSVSPFGTATIDENGLLTTSTAEGDLLVSATDAAGRSAATTWVKVRKAKALKPGGGGCTPIGQAKERTDAERTGDLASFALPILAGFLVRLRGSRQRKKRG